MLIVLLMFQGTERRVEGLFCVCVLVHPIHCSQCDSECGIIHGAFSKDKSIPLFVRASVVLSYSCFAMLASRIAGVFSV